MKAIVIDAEAAHECEARVEDEWVVYTCPKCPAYERRINQRTDEMTASGMQLGIQHSGTYAPLRENLN
jgi:hypothetical protein